jgi:mRNA-degrading endonuclease RelE of RelBE toxin-antitoxin system
MAYQISFSRDAERQLRQLTARDRNILLEAIEEQLSHQPEVPTHRRRLMRENPLAEWENIGCSTTSTATKTSP